MVIYEVNLTIDRDIYQNFQLWLKDHIQEMLQFSGFIQACISKPEEKKSSLQELLTIHYKIENREALEEYLQKLAPKMREKGIKRFNNKFSAERRIYEILDIIFK